MSDRPRREKREKLERSGVDGVDTIEQLFDYVLSGARRTQIQIARMLIWQGLSDETDPVVLADKIAEARRLELVEKWNE